MKKQTKKNEDGKHDQTVKHILNISQGHCNLNEDKVLEEAKQNQKLAEIYCSLLNLHESLEEKKSLELEKYESFVGKSKEKDDFLNSMSHDIRTPINAMLATVTLLEEDNPSPSQKELLNILKIGSVNLRNIVNDILDLGKIDAGAMHLDKRFFVIEDFIKETTKLFTPISASKKLKMCSDLKLAAKPFMYNDKQIISRILINLLNNSMKFTKSGSITVSARTENNEHILSVTDTGIGIDEKNLNKIFEAFTQENASTRTSYGGTGLGLSICKKLSGLIGAHISVTSKKGAGSTFSLHLPTSFSPVYCESEHRCFAPLTKNKSIAIVLEDRELRNKISSSLKSFDAFFLVLEANNPLLEAFNFEIMITDQKNLKIISLKKDIPTILFIGCEEEKKGYKKTKHQTNQELYIGKYKEEILIPILANIILEKNEDSTSQAVTKPAKLVYIDDADESLKLIELTLKKTNHTCTFFSNAELALEYIKKITT